MMRSPSLLLQLALLFAAVGLGIVAGIVTLFIMAGLVANDELPSMIGTGVWLSTSVALLGYGNLYFVILPRSHRHTGMNRNHAVRQTTGISLAFVFIGGAIARVLNPNDVVTNLGAFGWGAVGYLVGQDLRRRERMLGRLEEEKNQSRT